MVYVELNPGRNFLVRVEHDLDLIRFVTELAEMEKIEVATITAVGALKQAARASI